jgi:hypothetical protein
MTRVLPLHIEMPEVEIEIADSRVISDPDAQKRLIQPFNKLQWLVHLVDNGEGPEYHIFAMAGPVVKANFISLPGRLSQVIRIFDGDVKEPPPWFTAVSDMKVNEVALVGSDGKLIFDGFIPAIFKPISIRVLTNGSETRALIIPVTANGRSNALSPLSGGSYRLDFDLGQVHLRNQAADEETTVRARASLVTQW